MLFQPTNIFPDIKNGVGSGTIDATEPLSIVWQVNGNSPMTAYKVQIYANDTASTLKYDSGKTDYKCPFNGTDYLGDVIPFMHTISSSTLQTYGISNGNEYKIIITQWYGATDDKSVRQSSASVFITRTNPTVTINPFADNLAGDVLTRHKTFTATYYQAQGDAIRSVRWYLALTNDESNPFYDSKDIYTSELKMTYDGFMRSTYYSVRLVVETVNGQKADTGWISFYVGYSAGSITGCINAHVAYDCSSSVYVRWNVTAISGTPTVIGWAVYRMKTTDSTMKHIIDTGVDETEIYDYSIPSTDDKYRYIVYPIGATTYLSNALVSEEISPTFWKWSVLETEFSADGYYEVINEYVFDKNLSTSAISNGNSPSIASNFTKYPTVQLSSQNYKSGSLESYIGTITNGKYSDTIKQRDAIFELSTTTHTLFLKNRKGDVILIRPSESISMTTDDATYAQAQTVSFSWVEIGDASEFNILKSSLERIEITNPPTTTLYEVGTVFDTTGMVVTAYYTPSSHSEECECAIRTGDTEVITDYTYSPTRALTMNDHFITISYTNGRVVRKAYQQIVVTEIIPE